MANDAQQGSWSQDTSVPTSLLTYEPSAGPANCLALAARSARDGFDEIVFLSAPEHQDAEPGHVVLRDRRTAAVREPDAVVDGASAVSVEAYAAVAGRRVLAIVSAGLVRSMLRLSPMQRAAALVELSGPLTGVAHLTFGAVGPVTPVGQGGSKTADGPSAKAAETLSADWDKYKVGKMSGTDFSNPSSKLPQDLQDALKFVNNDTTLYDAMIKGNGGKAGDPLTKADVDKFVKDAKSDAGSVDSKKTDPWSSATGLSDAQKSDLNAPLDAARNLAANWHAWGLSSGVTDFSKVPTDIPQDGKDALKSIEQSPAMMKAIGSGDGKSNVITQKDVVNFVNKASDDAKAGAGSYGDFVKANPGASDATKTLAQSAAIVRGNQTLFSAGSTDPKGPVDGNLRSGDLGKIADTASMGSALKDAARLWSQPGMFSQLDTGGQDLATSKPDGIAGGGNITDWMSKQAPSMTGAALGSLLSDAADRNSVANVDISKLGPDVFANPGKYTGEQKAAVLQQLTDTNARVTAGNDGGEWAGAVNNMNGLSPDPKKPGLVNADPNQVKGDIATKIAQLTADPDVQKFSADNRAKSLQTIASADPALQKGLQSFYDGDLQSGKALTDSLNTKDANGIKVTTEAGLQSFVQTANVLSTALGTDGKSKPDLDLQKIAEKSGQQGALQQAYTDDILSGKSLKGAIDGGTDTGTAVQQFSIDAANFGAMLPTKFVSDNAQKLQQTFSDTVSDGLLGNATQADVNTAFADKNGNLDTAKLTDAITQAIAQNPDLGKNSQGATLKPDQIVAAVGTVFADVRNGTKLQDALNKLSTQQNSDHPAIPAPKGVAADAYNKGLMHAVGAVFNTGVLVAKGVEGAGSGSGTAAAGVIAAGMQVMGGVLEGGSKYAKSSLGVTFSSNELKGIEGAGKQIGGAGGIIGGALGIFSGVQSLKSGDPASGGLSIANGITGAWSGVSSAIEGGLGIADSLGIDLGADVAAVAATSATLGIVGGVVAGLGAVGLGIYGIVEGAKHVNDYTGQIQPELTQFGITGGNAPSSNPPVDPPPPGEP